ncbi:hypothetical protein ACFYNO_24840 [Kitasatospora sp. NPDC006697]|uniref:hypothetical protein n=1 Tax=Kitasatospora sp. NPDC006697 TaxID=3364020 RepID=UPI00367D973A
MSDEITWPDADQPDPRPDLAMAERETYRLRAHDAWALPLGKLLEHLGMTAMETPAPEVVLGALFADAASGGRIYLCPGLEDKRAEHVIRLLVCRYLAKPASLLCAEPSSGPSGAVVFSADDISGFEDEAASPAPPAELSETGLRALYGESPWAPVAGWRTDEQVIEALKDLIVQHLDGIAEDVPPHVRPVPDGIGAAVAFGYDADGQAHPIVYVDADLPSGLRADLWGFCAALAGGADPGGVDPSSDGVYYVGTQRLPVTGPGVSLLAALMVQQLGRRPGDCSFPLTAAPETASSSRTEVADAA